MVSKLLLVRCRPSRTSQPYILQRPATQCDPNVVEMMRNMANDVPSSLRRALPDFLPTMFSLQTVYSGQQIENIFFAE